ncbi:NAC domain-containing protein 104 [Rutidosis leptorrhynchoides]|uniref:NAC domain-containing protein 104 n=1 Tax=Rutidosis leptorrhynchoides TaxID=125765 RepID=UPI003A99D45A
MSDYNNNNNVNNLPPGFRFCPTDEELVVHFLQRKASLLPYHPDIIPDLDLYPYDPWDLDGKAMEEGKKWYYYSRRTQNRITTNGYWKPWGCDEQIISSRSSKRVIGVKKYYVFHIGEDNDEQISVKTNWIMQEFRFSDGASSSNCSSSSSSNGGRSKRRSHSKSDFSKWVICRVFEHDCDNDDDDDGPELSCLDEVFLSLDDFDDISFPN